MPVKKQKISNNSQLLLVDLPEASSMSFIILSGVGSRYETDENAGVSHLAEHCLFKGSKKYPSPNDVSFTLESLGAAVDAGTSKEYTYYLVKVVPEEFEQATDVLLDIYMNPLLEEKEISREKRVVLEEIRMYKDNPMDVVVELYNRSLWKKHPLGRKISGSITSVRGLGRDDILKHVNQFYTGASTVFVVAGDLKKNKVEKRLVKKLNSLKKGRSYNPKVARKVLRANELVVKKENVEQCHLILGTYGLGLNDSNRFPLAVGNTVLGQGMGSRLYRMVRQSNGLAYYINSGNLSYSDSGSIYIRAGVDKNKIEKSLSLIMDEIKRIIQGEIEDDDCSRAKQILKSSLTLDLDSTDSVGLYVGLQEVLVKKPLSVRDIKKLIDSVTKEEIIKVFQEIFSQPLLTALISPQELDSGKIKKVLKL